MAHGTKKQIIAQQHRYYLKHREERKEKNKEKLRQWRDKNKEKLRQWRKFYYQKNKQKITRYYQVNKEELKKRSRLYSKKHKEELKIKQNGRKSYTKIRRKKYGQRDYVRVKQSIRCRIRNTFKRQSLSKRNRTLEYLGCSLNFYIAYIEQQFYNGMTWDNRGYASGTWQIHHIIPCECFDLNDPIEQKQCFHFSNTKPLWHQDHINEHLKLNSHINII